MIFKVKATITCQCGYTKTFDAEADIHATVFRDSEELSAWDDDSITLKRVAFEGVCPDCKYNLAA